MVETTEVLKTVGDKTSAASTGVIKWLSELGLNINATQGKIVSLIIILVVLYIVIKLVEFSKPIVKWTIVILLILLAVSIGISLI